MNGFRYYDCAVLGAGIAGISVTSGLLRRGKSVLLVDQSGAGMGASGAPLALLNPATGRRARKTWSAETCMSKTLGVLQEVQNSSGKYIFFQNGVIRPAITQKLATNFRKALNKYDWPPGWVDWIEKEQVHSLLEGIAGNSGGLMIKKAATVRLGQYMQAAIDHLTKQGARFIVANRYEARTENDMKLITIDGTTSFQAKSIINSTGYGVRNFKEWDFIDFEFVKGQLLKVSFNSDLQIKHSVSSLGYFAVTPDNNSGMVVGSTYEHQFGEIEPDISGRKYLLKKLHTTFPGLSGLIEKSSLWSGVRVSTGNRLPVAGEHPSLNGMYILNGLGSKGLLYGQHCADLLADFIINRKPLPPEIDVSRYY